jgi:serine/threonine protein kinase
MHGVRPRIFDVFSNFVKSFFAGNSEIDQLYKIASIMGTPGRNDWPDGSTLANSMSFRFPTFQPTHLSNVLGPRSSARAVSFLYAMLSWNPAWRSSAQEALKHSYFRFASNFLVFLVPGRFARQICLISLCNAVMESCMAKFSSRSVETFLL